MLRELIPSVLLEPGPFGLERWQWLALPVLLFASWTLGHLASRVTRWLLGRVVKRTSTQWDDELLARMGGPTTLAMSLLVAFALLPLVELPTNAEAFVHRTIRGLGFVAFFWAIVRTIDVSQTVIERSPWARAHTASRALVPLSVRVIKVIVAAIAIVALLSEFGYPVASLIAGLGIGGLAFALAAQKTVENLFGAFSIGADEPFRPGDTVRIEDFVGTVEVIGLRSTRIRTHDRTIISIPNGKLAEMRLETFAERDRIRLACTVGLVYDTSVEQMRSVLAGLEGVLRGHPKIWPDNVVVRFKELAASSLDIEIVAWFQTQDWAEFQRIRQDVLLEFMEVVAKAGTSFAFPTRTVHVVSDSVPS